MIVPAHPGVFSALGLLLADLRVDKVWTQAFRSTQVDAALVERQFERIAERAVAELRQEGFIGEPRLRRAINMRYLGQNYEHEVEMPDGALDHELLVETFRRFERLHEERYGYAIEGEVIELLSFKVTAIGRRPRVELAGANGAAERPRAEREVYFRGHGFVPTPRSPPLGARGRRDARGPVRDRGGGLDDARRAGHAGRAVARGLARRHHGGRGVKPQVTTDQVTLTVIDNYLTTTAGTWA